MATNAQNMMEKKFDEGELDGTDCGRMQRSECLEMEENVNW